VPQEVAEAIEEVEAEVKEVVEAEVKEAEEKEVATLEAEAEVYLGTTPRDPEVNTTDTEATETRARSELMTHLLPQKLLNNESSFPNGAPLSAVMSDFSNS
jgi:hypothetical protein